MKVIVVTGTPGTGKTKVAKKLAKGLKYLDVNKVLEKYKLKEKYDKKRRTWIVDVDKLNKVLIEIISKSKKGLVIDSHLGHYLPPKYVKLCIVTKCSLKVLKGRLEKRGYSKLKVRENLESEAFDICLNEAKEEGHKVKVVDTTKL
jgi:adenylate kinase